MKELTFAEIMKLPEDTLIKVLDHSKFALSGIFCEGKLKKKYNYFRIETCGISFNDDGNKQFTFIQIKPNKSFSQRISERVSGKKWSLTRGGKTRRHKKQKKTKRTNRRH